jgi:hypothetical protein
VLGTAPLGTAPLGSTRAVASGGPSSYSATGSGGVTVAGSAPASTGWAQGGVGGVVVGGTAPATVGRVYVGSGGVRVGGAASAVGSHHYEATGSGGVTVAGGATAKRGWRQTSSGGVIVAGSAAPVVGRVRVGAGGVRVGGTWPVVYVGEPPPAPTPPGEAVIQRWRGYTGPGWVGDRATRVPATGAILVRGGAAGVIQPPAAGAVGMVKRPKGHGHGGGQIIAERGMRHGEGGVRVGGAAESAFYQGSGGPIISPTGYVAYAHGGVNVGGIAGVAASTARQYARAASGGVTVLGAAAASAVVRQSYSARGSGLILVRGSSPFSRYLAPAPGGGTLSGAFVTPDPPATFDTTRNPAHFAGPTVTASSMADLQTKLNTVAPGTVIGVPLGANWTGNLVLKDRGFGPTEWIEVRPALTPAALDAIVAYGRRMNPGLALANDLPTLRSPGGNVSLVYANAAAAGYRFSGLQLLAGGQCNGIVRLGKPDMATAADACRRMIYDRCTVIGSTSYPVQRGFYACGEEMAVLGCWIADCYGTGDSQAILCGGWQGPYMFLWNRCEGWSENFMLGGFESPAGAGGDPRAVASDVTFHYNYCTKNLAQKGINPFGSAEKNLNEAKSVRRCSNKYNIYEYMWLNGQDTAVNLKSVNQTKTQPQQGTTDYEFAWNWIRTVGGAIKFAADPEGGATPAKRMYVHDNLWEGVNTVAGFTGGGLMVGLYGGLSDITLDHNTFVKALGAGTSMPLVGAAIGPIALRGNLLHLEGYGMKLTSTPEGNASWQGYIPNPGDRIWLTNGIIGKAIATYPAGSIAIASDSAVGYADLAGGDYTVTGPLATAAYDGGPLGISDMVAFRANLTNVQNG